MIGNNIKKQVKVCGINDANTLLELVKLEVNYVGFIFYSGSLRNCTLSADVVKALPVNLKKIGVFVNAHKSEIAHCVKEFDLQGLQLHGSEEPQYCAELREKFPHLLIFKAIGIAHEKDFKALECYVDAVDYFIFDTKTPLYGGSGKSFDWELLQHYTLPVPFFLSGGISLESVEQLNNLQHTGLSGLDMNSRFEIKPGMKDIAQVAQFIAQLNGRYAVNVEGYYGAYGGAYIPEMLHQNVEELKRNYLKIIQEPDFEENFRALLSDYVGRPSPLYKAERLSKHYSAKIYLKREDLNHTGAHKINNTIGQILLAQRMGKKRIVAETGAGQHGVATATVCALKGLECVVFMGAVDMERQASNVARMKMLGATVVAATSGSQTLKDATNEAMRYWINNASDTYYIIGSVVGPHPYPDMVARFQSVISEESRNQLLQKEGTALPNYVLACVGGGSNAMGMFYHYLDEPNVRLIAIEAGGKGIDSGFSAATTCLGKEGVLHGSRSILMQTADGQVLEPHSISAGLDYPGIGPQHAYLFKNKRTQYVSITDEESLEAGLLLTRLEGIIPAIESAHALAQLKKMQLSTEDVVLVCLSGRGDKDLATYNHYFNHI